MLETQTSKKLRQISLSFDHLKNSGQENGRSSDHGPEEVVGVPEVDDGRDLHALLGQGPQDVQQPHAGSNAECF